MIESPDVYFGDKPERCVLVGIVLPSQSRWEAADHLMELEALAQTSDAVVVEHFLQERARPDSAYFIGKGKVEEIADFIEEHDIDLIIFDDELTPAQTRNLERFFEKKVIDRAALILDIFAKHAQTNEAKVQVELAQLNYLLPRLTRQWQHLSRQVGGIGTKGPGETQLETDRRLVRERIARLRKKLQRIARQKQTQRQQRESYFRAALIGYTNAGKSTILRSLTEADVLVQDQLFATLDTTVKRFDLGSTQSILLSDTVGFIRKLPHHLVASFRTTLSETLEADLLLHVVDASHPHFEDHIRVVNQILEELKVADKMTILVFNKVDRLENPQLMEQLKESFPQAVFISATKGIGFTTLKKQLRHAAESQYELRELVLDATKGAAEHLLYPLATVLNKSYEEETIHLSLKYPIENRDKIIKIEKTYGLIK